MTDKINFNEPPENDHPEEGAAYLQPAAPKFYAVEYAGFWNIQNEEGYTEKANILDAENVGEKEAEKFANLIVKLLNKHYHG